MWALDIWVDRQQEGISHRLQLREGGVQLAADRGLATGTIDVSSSTIINPNATVPNVSHGCAAGSLEDAGGWAVSTVCPTCR